MGDANEDWVIDGIIAAMRFTRQSQSCTAGSRLFLHRDIFDKFLDALGQKVRALKDAAARSGALSMPYDAAVQSRSTTKNIQTPLNFERFSNRKFLRSRTLIEPHSERRRG